jgi:hypothetical protein
VKILGFILTAVVCGWLGFITGIITEQTKVIPTPVPGQTNWEIEVVDSTQTQVRLRVCQRETVDLLN